MKSELETRATKTDTEDFDAAGGVGLKTCPAIVPQSPSPPISPMSKLSGL